MYKNLLNKKLVNEELATLTIDAENKIISLKGSWTWVTINDKNIFNNLKRLHLEKKLITINASNISHLDTQGVYFIYKIINFFKKNKIVVENILINDKYKNFYEQISKNINNNTNNKLQIKSNILFKIGKYFIDTIKYSIKLTEFFGNFCFVFYKWILHPINFAFKDCVDTIYRTGINGLIVCGLLNFLIGVTLVYELSPQFITYGANVYIVNFLGISLLKEVTPLLTAIIVAGRTGSAITAEIGTMKVQEEIDALKTMGISPISRIVLPKVLGIMIALPLLTTLTDIISMYGGAIVANNKLGVNYSLFISRLQNYVPVHNFTDGIIKSIVFAFLISLTSCFCGFKVKANAISIGENTTQSVVVGIILIIIFDAIFAVIFNILGR